MHLWLFQQRNYKLKPGSKPLAYDKYYTQFHTNLTIVLGQLYKYNKNNNIIDKIQNYPLFSIHPISTYTDCILEF